MIPKIAVSTCPNDNSAQRIADGLLDLKLAACVNIIPNISSVYTWQGARQHDAETLLIIKTADAKLTELEQALLELHPYDTPEFLVLDPELVTEKYRQWLLESLA